jgi:GMP synthase (glutamine-hydrolysing)
MKPFVLLSIRAEDAAADNEYESFLSLGGLEERDLRRVRLEQRALGEVDLANWSGILLGGGPFNYSDPEQRKSPVQRRVETDLRRLLDTVVAKDFPFLGACYGVGALGSHQGAPVSRDFGEPVGAVRVVLTAQGRNDPLLRDLPASFDAFTGHKEGIGQAPARAVLLATSVTCPVQAFRLGSNAYATQFHPEMDADALCTRIDVYKHAGYFDPASAEDLKALARRSSVPHPARILRAFIARYALAAGPPSPDRAVRT